MRAIDLTHLARLLIATSLAGAVLAGCEGGRSDPDEAATYGEADQGATLIELHECGSCHTIPGIPDAEGVVGPPLTQWAQRSYIAGSLPNRPENLVAWLMEPHAIEPGTAMPDLELSEQEARDIAAYLYTLE